MKNIMLIISLVLLILGCENVEPTVTGTIEGKVTIAPLCGNIPGIVNNTNPCGLSDEQLNEIYSKYKVTLSGKENTKIISKEVILNKTGLFTFEVPVGIYKVEVVLPDGMTNQSNSSTINSLIKEVSVTNNQVTKIELEVNTGIR